MKIIRVEAIPVRLPLKKPMLMGGRKYETCESVLVRLVTTDRIIGWGEAAVAPVLTGETTASIVAAVPVLAEQLIGRDPRDLNALGQLMRRAILGNSAAKAALDMALCDVVARSVGWPVHRLLGGKVSERLDCLWLVGNSEPSRDLAEAEAKANEGFRCLKLKVANGDLEQEAQTLNAMRKSLGPKVQICADANTNWSVSQATRFVRLVEPAYPDFLEQPVAGDDIDGLRRVAQASRVPIGADESLHDFQGIRQMIESGAAIGGSFKVMKFEGIANCLHAIRLCRALGGEVNLSGKLGESSIANAATLSLATAFGPPSWGLSLTNHYLSEDLVHEPIAVNDGMAHPSDDPGLGIEVNESRLANFEFQPGPRVQDPNRSEAVLAATSL
jgi:muconate cycloisomerase